MIDSSIHPDDDITGNPKRYHEKPFPCPKDECGLKVSEHIKTINLENAIVRKRRCKCGHVFQTVEKIENATCG
jgi:hypothetical protein